MGDGRVRSWRARGLAALLLAAVAAQFVPLRPDNPPVTAVLVAPAPVQAVLQRSCADCHSNETRWPWYAHVAPVAWLVVDHVHEGRAQLNFSTCGQLPEAKLAKLPRRCWHQVEKGDMPLASYLWIHRGARLTDADRAALRDWAASAPPAGPQEAGGASPPASGRDHD
jgi:hypothetical protein